MGIGVGVIVGCVSCAAAKMGSMRAINITAPKAK
jgi:hypothetical protein